MNYRQNRRKMAEKRKVRVFMIIPLVLLAANICLLLRIERQIKAANTTLKQLDFMQDEQENAVRQQDENELPDVGQEGTQKYLPALNDTAIVEPLDYASMCELPKVDKPIQREFYEVLAKLKDLGQENDVIAQILKNSDAYPEKMLEALANNPEMADFVENYLTQEGEATGGLTELEKQQEYPLFLQWDPRWGYVQYGDDDSNIGLSGCGPTCLSMALYYLIRDETLTPDVIASYSMDNGYYLAGTGTLWALMEDFPSLYGVKVSQPEISEWSMKSELDKSNILICSMGAGDFTAGGHFIVIYGYDENGFQVNDSNCVARSRLSWSFKQIQKQIKHIWSFGN